MESASVEQAAGLRAKIRDAEENLRKLKEELATLMPEGTNAGAGDEDTPTASMGDDVEDGWKWPLSAEEYERYGRQLIIPSVGVEGQLRLKKASVLFVGAGGLGCPAAAYIAGAGIGTIGMVDGDVVEASNLHRQIAHTTLRVGMSKVESAIAYLKGLNPRLTYRPYLTHLTPQNAEEIISQYDIVLDCTDHPTSRYLVSDTCVLLSKPLVSAAAFRTDGQLIVLNAPALSRGDASGGPCYRCVFPKPPPPSSVVSCGEGGILGPVVGTMGVLQALEAIRLVASGILDHSGKTSSPEYPTEEDKKTLQPSLLIFSTTSKGPSFRSVRMRGRRADCFACSSSSKLTLQSLKEGGVDYVRFCGVNAPVQVLKPEERISPAQYAARHPSPAPSGSAAAPAAAQPPTPSPPLLDHVLLDVREREHFGIANIPGAVNIPLSTLLRESTAAAAPAVENEMKQSQRDTTTTQQHIRSHPQPQPRTTTATTTATATTTTTMAMTPDWLPANLPLHAPIYVVCRVGNDSQLAAKRLKDMGLDRGGERFVGDIKGGMKAWKEEVDDTLPFT
ncbi:molybdenum cofactor biosynthetic protein [Zalerion maritima]|uniref:Adenylyltransferase and sulfurtransferase uba4 n=1 Tax=Zalerion maritima TaxID=339359 RepID=A0AAD5RQE4_9PEZI|nr:molybdenum cofactor biosynthetic protein [Zalerion maritima]